VGRAPWSWAARRSSAARWSWAARRLWPVVAVSWLALSPQGTWAQVAGEVEVAANPDQVVLGQPFRLQIRLTTEEGWSVEAPDSIPGVQGFHPQGPVQVTRTETGEGTTSWLISYPMVPLRPGFRPLPSLPLTLSGPGDTPDLGSTESYWILLKGLAVESVLPAPDGPVTPAPFIDPPDQARGLSPLGPWALIVGFLSGSGLLVLHRRRRKKRRIRWGGNEEANPDEEQPDLREQLTRALDGAPTTSPERVDVFDRSALLVRQIIESETPRTLVGLTTPELVVFLRNGSRIQTSSALEEALLTSEDVRFRKEPPTSDEFERFRSSLREWLGQRAPEPDVQRDDGDHV